jgi:hypothetical protein
VTAIAEQPTPSIPEFVSIAPLSGNQSTTTTPTFTFTPNSFYSPIQPIVRSIYYQVDTWQNAWSIANSTDGATWTGTTSVLQPGVHIIYAWAGDGAEATSINRPVRAPAPKSPSSPIIGQIAAYVFVVVPSPAVTLSTNVINFGNQAVGTTSASQPVTLTNTGNGALTINSIATTADFAQTNNCGSVVAASANCTINVTFTPGATGARNGALTISDSASGSPRIVNLSGTGIAPAVSLSASVLNFGNQQVGTTSIAQTVTVTNTGNASLTLNSISASGGFAQTNNCGASLAASSACAINVTFTPSTAGAWLGTLSISDNASGSPHTITLAGTGTTAALIVSTSNLVFAGQRIGTTSAAQSVTISNVGAATLTLSSINTTGDFAQTNTCGGSLSPGMNCVINVTFTPTAVAARSGALTITHNAAGSPTNVNLSGTGLLAIFFPVIGK